MLALAQKTHIPASNPATKTGQDQGRIVQNNIRKVLSQAVDLKELVYEAAQAMRDGFNSPEDAEVSRARAMAVSQLCKSFKDMTDVIRVARGKPLPGSLRPESKSKPKKAQPNTFTEE